MSNKKFASNIRKEGKESILGKILFHLYRLSQRNCYRKLIHRLVLKLEGDCVYSITIRRIFSKYHDVEVGSYSGRGPFNLGHFKAGTKIGRYTAIYTTVLAFNANHPMNTKSTHAFFFNPGLGLTKTDLLSRTELTIGNDVWIGHNAIILSGVSSIGDGAIVGAGAVLHKDIPPYAVVVGNPARVVRYRFSEEKIEELLESKWWEKSIDELLPEIESFQKPLETEGSIR
jgi:virginiamycin A acetyltransferase